MKTLHATINSQVTDSRARIRFVLTLAGILTAILCSMALRQEVRTSEGIDRTSPRVVEASRIIVAGLVGEVKAWL